jgi:hypothetical protein
VRKAIETWLVSNQETVESKFAESATPFIEQLLDENQQLFERLAKL